MRAVAPILSLFLLLFMENVSAKSHFRPASSAHRIATRPVTRRGEKQKPLPTPFVGGAQSSNGKVAKSFDEENKVPRVLVGWISLYRAIPKLNIPYTNLDFSFTILSALFFTCLDYSFAEILCSALGWPRGSKDTRAVAGSMSTIFHSTLLVLGTGACLSTQRYDPSGKMEAHPDWWQDAATALIQMCTGYMIYDSAVQFIADRWSPGIGPVLSTADWLFLGHHFATSFYMTSSRLVMAGHMSALMWMFLGELTAPLQNLFRISRIANQMDCCGGPMVEAAHPYIEYCFSLLYAFFRIFVGPLCAVHLTYDLLSTRKGRENVPLGLSLLWLVMSWGVILGSIPWIASALEVIRGGPRVLKFV